MVQVVKATELRRAASKKITKPKVDAAGGGNKRAGESAAELPLPSVATVLINGRRKDLEALAQASKQSLRVLAVVAQRQTAALKDAVLEWQAVTNIMAATSNREIIGSLDKLGRGVIAMALENVRELAALAAETQAGALDVVKHRIGEDVQEIKQMLKRD